MNRRSVVIVCGVVLAAFLPSSGVQAVEKPIGTVAVMPLDARDASFDRRAVRSLEEELRTVAGDRLRPLGYLVLTQETTLALLTDNGIDSTKACDGTCALANARELKAALFLTGTIISTGGRHLLYVKLFESSSGQQLASVELEEVTVQALREKIASAVEPLFKALTAPPSEAPAPAAVESVEPPPEPEPSPAPSPAPPEHGGSLSSLVDSLANSLDLGIIGRFDRFTDWNIGLSAGIGFSRVRLYVALTVPAQTGAQSVPSGFESYGKGLAGGLLGVAIRDLGPLDLVLEAGIDAPTVHCKTSADTTCLLVAGTSSPYPSLTVLRAVTRLLVQHRFLINVATSQDGLLAGFYADVGAGVGYMPAFNDTGVNLGTPVGLAVVLNVGMIVGKKPVWERR